MRIAVITGASSGMGKQFALKLKDNFSVDEVWLIARNRDRLNQTAENCGIPAKVFSMDLGDTNAYFEYINALKENNPDVALLVNCSGFGKFAAFCDTPMQDNLNMIDINCKALTAMTQLTLPYMHEGAKIVNVASVAAYQPIPYINVYAATKSYVLFFSRALNRELKSRKISVTAICPFWTKTTFFDRAINKDDKDVIVKKYAVLYDPEKVVDKAYKDVARGKEISIYGSYARFQCFLTKILPHKFVMNVWLSQQKLKNR